MTIRSFRSIALITTLGGLHAIGIGSADVGGTMQPDLAVVHGAVAHLTVAELSQLKAHAGVRTLRTPNE